MIAYLCLLSIVFTVNTLVPAKNTIDRTARVVSLGFLIWTVLLLAAAL